VRTADTADVDEAIARWIVEQRWFGGKGRAIAAVRSTGSVLADGDPAVWLRVVQVDYGDGGSERYLVPLSVRSATSDELAYALVGEVPTADGALWLHDALHDRASSRLWMQLLASAGAAGPLQFTRLGEPVPGLADAFGDAITAEQSNTSLIYGETAIVKFFRRLQTGVNPDVEIHEALTEAGNPHIAPLLGYAVLDLGEDGSATAAMVQEFLSAASDGWALATASVRDLYAEGDLRADEVGGDFAGEARRLGAATASVHADLAAAFGVTEADSQWLHQQQAEFGERLDHALSVVPDLAPHADALRREWAAAAALPTPGRLQRVHGDFHLGQALRTAVGWTILDFEGEPVKAFAERRRFSTPLRDIAGMLRSFDYAAWTLLLDGQEDPQRAYRAREWSTRNREAFCEGYAGEAGADPRDSGALLRALEADKAVYEAVYEARNRPAWLSVPVRSLERIAAGEAP
jgi:maltokinase